jgi:hypothetical protein
MMKDNKHKTIPSFKTGPYVSFSYANYQDCKRYDIKPIPWLWGENWVRERINHGVKTIGVLVNRPDGTFIEIYKKINQPHTFYNMVIQPHPLPWHIHVNTISIDLIKECDILFNQIISWDSSVIFMGQNERRYFWSNIEQCLSPTGRITLAWNHFNNMTEIEVDFMNSKEFRCINHHFRGNFDPSDFDFALRIRRGANESKGYLQFCEMTKNDLLPDSDVMCIPYFDLIDPTCFLDTVDSLKKLKRICLSTIGSDMEFFDV